MISTIDRRRIYIFVALAYAMSIAVALVLIFTGGLDLGAGVVNPLWSILGRGLMFAPTVANIATRLITREGWSNTLLRPNLRRGWPLYLAALLLPALATLVGGAIYYLLFPSRFDPSMTYARGELGMRSVRGATDPWTFIVIQTAFTIATSLFSIPLMFGEEFGWRAYLLPKLVPLGPRQAVLLVGTIHGVWHWPVILLGYEYGLDYWGAPVVGPLLFVWIAFLLSTFLGWLTLHSGSVWPAAIGHGVMNSSPLLMVWFVRGPIDPPIGPVPVGIIGSLGLVVLALPIFFIPGALAPTADPQTGHSASRPRRRPCDRTSSPAGSAPPLRT